MPYFSPPEPHASTVGGDHPALLRKLYLPARGTAVLVLQTAALLPPLLLSRRALNLTWTAFVDYFRGRIFRTTFTQLERAYLRYYEFPAATRSMARLVSQVGILLGLSWAVRWWMMLVLMGNNGVGPTVLGVEMTDIGMVGTNGGKWRSLIWPGWRVGLPCHRRGKGLAWLCSLVWIGAAVGIGHLLAVALSVWGGPLRLQAVAQQAEKPTSILKRVAMHPILWIRGLEEWKYIPSMSKFRRRDGTDEDRDAREGAFRPAPALFPATWLPLRWLQIFAVAKAFSTDPLRYRWCAPEDDRVVIPRLMKQYLVQLALSDEWRRVFFDEKRVGLGIMVVLSYFVGELLSVVYSYSGCNRARDVRPSLFWHSFNRRRGDLFSLPSALVWMVFTTFTLDGGATAMLMPSVLAAAISALMNITIFLNRLPSRERRRALSAMGLEEWK